MKNKGNNSIGNNVQQYTTDSAYFILSHFFSPQIALFLTIHELVAKIIEEHMSSMP